MLNVCDDAFEPVKLTIQVQTVRRNNFDVLAEWLRGKGTLILGNQSDRAWEGQIIEEVAFNAISNDLCEANINIECKPFKRKYPKENAITLTSGGTVKNPGNVNAKPKISIAGSGNIGLTVNGNLFSITNVVDGVVLDCDARLALNDDETASVMEKTDGDFPVLIPGDNTVSWTGTVTSVTIEPRWRWH